MGHRPRFVGAGGLPPFRFDPTMGCRDVDPEVMVPDRYTGTGIAAARQVCATCPIWETCLEWAVGHELNFGVYAGTTPDQRRRIAKGVDPWPPGPPVATAVVEPKTETRTYAPKVNVADRDRLFAAAREFVAGAGRDDVLARYGLSKAGLYRAVWLLRHPDLVDEVVALRMTLATARRVARARRVAA